MPNSLPEKSKIFKGLEIFYTHQDGAEANLIYPWTQLSSAEKVRSHYLLGFRSNKISQGFSTSIVRPNHAIQSSYVLYQKEDKNSEIRIWELEIDGWISWTTH